MIRRARFCIAILVLSFTYVQAQPAQPPPSLIKTLDSLKKANDLSNWLYQRIDYAYAQPRERLAFLMATEKALWRKPGTGPEKEAWLMLLSNQGYNQLYAGQILESIDRYEKAYNYYTDHKLSVEGVADYVLKPWANNYTRLGDYEKALFIQQKTLDYAKSERDTSLSVSMYNNMAISHRSMGNLQQAEQYVMLGLNHATPGSPELILLNNTLADIYKEQGNLDKAEHIIQTNITRQLRRERNFETAYWLLSSYISAGDIQLEKQQYSRAEQYYRIGLAINEKYYKGNRLREKVNIINQLGKVKLKQGRSEEAIILFNQTLQSLGLLKADGIVDAGSVYGDNRIIEVFRQKALAFQLASQNELALENMQLALFAADKIRFELADVKTRQRFQAETRQMAAEAVAIAFHMLQKTNKHRYAVAMLQIFEQAKARTLLDDIRRNKQQLRLQIKDTLFVRKQALERAVAYHEKQMLLEENPQETQAIHKNILALRFKAEYIEKQLQEKYPALKQSAQVAPFLTGDLLKELPSDLHFIEFFATEDAWYVLEIRNKKIAHIKRIAGANHLRQRILSFVDTYYSKGPSAMANNPRNFYQISHSIYQDLLSGFPLNKQLKTVIITDEVLGYLSFDGLITKEQYTPSISKWPFLIHQASISYAFSIQTWLSQSQRRNSKDRGFSGLFITHQQGNQQPIPAVIKEAEAIENTISGHFLKDKKATAQRFFEAFDQSSLLHISTHAFLSGKQKEPTLAFQNNDVFLFELSARKQAPALVVLSACRTADGIMAAGEGVISLSRGFATIGAQGTIAGLWNVNDEAAATITAAAYANMLANKKISSSLRDAKLQWLQNKRNSEQEYLPYFWDALIFVGYDQQLELKPAEHFSATLIYLIAGILLSLATTWFVLKQYRIKVANSAP